MKGNRYLKISAVTTAVVFAANLLLVPLAQAEEVSRRTMDLNTFMVETGAFPKAWPDMRKGMKVLKQRVKDSRLDLDRNGLEFYQGKAKVMIELERQRMRRAVKYLLRNKHGERFKTELRETGEDELIELANQVDLSIMADTNAAGAVYENYLGFRMKGYEETVIALEKKEIRKVMVDTEEAVDEYIESGGDVRRLNRGIFADQDSSGSEEQNTRSKILRWVIVAVAGVGLVLALFFSFNTMSVTPFLTFMSTAMGLLALLGQTGAFRNIFYGNPYAPHPGPYNPYQPWNPYYPGGWPPPRPPGT